VVSRRRRIGMVPVRITTRDTPDVMAKAISVRLDDEAERALRTLEASGMSRSEAIRTSLLASAERLRRRKVLAAEAAALEADEADRAEMAAVAELMETLRAAR
jgi:Arc/MetJ-type ribon-helix-helix transcriptional regulator